MITDAQIIILSSKAEIIEKNEQYWTSSPLRSRLTRIQDNEVLSIALEEEAGDVIKLSRCPRRPIGKFALCNHTIH